MKTYVKGLVVAFVFATPVVVFVAKGFVGNCGVVMGFLFRFCVTLLAKGDFMGEVSFSESIVEELLLEGGIVLLGGFKFATCGLVCAKGSRERKINKN